MRLRFACLVLILCSASLSAATSDLFFSEYTEGSSFNKAVEIYNGTASAIDLGAGGYVLQLHSNGSATASQSLLLTGTIAAGDVLVVAHGSADPAIGADVLNSSVINFNGDDTVVLRKGTAILDVIGQIGFDPGTEWGTGLASTVDNTIRRKAAVCAGDTNGADAFDPAVEWDGFPIHTYDGFGAHVSDCGIEPPPVTPDLNVSDVAVLEADGVALFTVSLSIPAGDSGVTFDIATDDGTATAGSGDYVARSVIGATIPPGGTDYSFEVVINDDADEEDAETFVVEVTGVSGATVQTGTGTGTILNDDTPPTGTTVDLYISEYTEGTSFNKAIEIYNGSAVTVDLGAGYRLDLYSNGNTSATSGINLEGTLAPGDVFVIAHGSANAAILAVADATNNSVINFNGDDAVVLLKGGAVLDAFGQVGNDPGSAWTGGGVSTADRTLRRKAEVCAGDPIGGDAFDPSIEWEGFPVNTFDGFGFHSSTCNPGVPPPPPPSATAEIFEIQGSGDVSPFSNQIVETLGNVVTATGPAGFFIQTPDGVENDTATSNGIYVFTGALPEVQVGDRVDVIGRVVEFFGMTEFSGDIRYTVTGTGSPIPDSFELTEGFADFEQIESMLVHLSGGVAASGTDQFGSTAMVVAATRPFRADGAAHPSIFEVDPTDLGGDAAHRDIVGGAAIESATGAMTYSFNDYVVWTTALEFTNPPFPRAVRAAAAGEMTVGAQNMLRLFDDLNDPSIGEPVTPTEVYLARLAAFSDHIRNQLGSPDVLAVSEVEDEKTLEDLAARLNADEGGLGYTAHVLEGNDIGGIDVGFLVRDTVTIDSIEQLGADDTWTDPETGITSLLNDRPPLLLSGFYEGNGEPFAINVIAVHQRSMIDVETSSRVRAKRMEQAVRLAGYVNDLRIDDPNLRVVVTGDFNAFEFDDGFGHIMGAVTSGADLINQVLTVAATDRYSYIHEGAAQVLDHSLTSEALDAFVRSLEFARANADAPVLPGRVSDHDGLVLFLMTDHDGDGVADDQDQCSTGNAGATLILGGCDTGAPNVAFEGGCTLADRLIAMQQAAGNHGQFVSGASALLNQLVAEGLLTGAEKGAIQSCAAKYRP